MDRILTVDEAIKLGVPFGTTAAQVLGIQPASVTQRNTLTSQSAALSVLNEIDAISQRVNTFDPGPLGLNRFLQGGKAFLGGLTQTNPDAAQLMSQVGVLAQIIRGLGEKGTLATQDVQRALAIVPTPFTSKEVAQRNIAELKRILSSVRAGTISGATTQIQGNAPSENSNDPLGIL